MTITLPRIYRSPLEAAAEFDRLRDEIDVSRAHIRALPNGQAVLEYKEDENEHNRDHQ